MDPIQRYFEKNASTFDRYYDARAQRVVRPGLFRGRDLAVDVVRSFAGAHVLDVGCGPGRVGEAVLNAGAAAYTGIDISKSMVKLARARLEPFGGRAQVLAGDFCRMSIEGRFDVVLGLGVFDYLPDAEAVLRRACALCTGAALLSFPRWHWIKGPVRKVRYQLANRCPIFDYREDEVRRLVAAAGFATTTIVHAGRYGFIVRADCS
jgi:SAM-dependent methyltransferase